MEGYTEVISCGSDRSGQLGLNKKAHKSYITPIFCSFNILIQKVSCGNEHSAFISISGHVYSMGSNAQGRLGVGSSSMKGSSSPVLVEGLPRCIDISCGWTHSAAVSRDGVAYSWGNGEHGALGTGSRETQWTPVRIQLSEKASQVSCGGRHTALVAGESLWCCGSGDTGQLGTGRREAELIPVRIQEAVTQAAAGEFHTLSLTRGGRVFGMGGNLFGQLGKGDKKSSSLPIKVEGLEGTFIVKVRTGHHSAAVSDGGELYIWGTGVFGEYLAPKLMNSYFKGGVKDISVGSTFSIAVDSSNKLYTWGNNFHGELGTGDCEHRPFPTMIRCIKDKIPSQVCAGSDFWIMLGKDIVKNKPEVETLKDNNRYTRRKSSRSVDFENIPPEKEDHRSLEPRVNSTEKQELQEQIRNLKHKLEEANSRIQEINSQHQEEKNAYERKYEDATREISNLTSALGLKKQNSKKSTRADARNEKQLRSKVETLEQENQKLNKALEDSRKEADDYYYRNTKSQKELQKTINECEELQSRNIQLTEQLERYKENPSPSLNTQSLKDQLNKEKDRNQHLSEEVYRLKEEVQNLSNSVKLYEEKLSEAQKELNILSRKNSELSQQTYSQDMLARECSELKRLTHQQQCKLEEWEELYNSLLKQKEALEHQHEEKVTKSQTYYDSVHKELQERAKQYREKTMNMLQTPVRTRYSPFTQHSVLQGSPNVSEIPSFKLDNYQDKSMEFLNERSSFNEDRIKDFTINPTNNVTS